MALFFFLPKLNPIVRKISFTNYHKNLINFSRKKWTPSPTGIGIGMLVPASAIITMFLGSVVEVVWEKLDKKSYERHLTPVASGFIAGEAIVAVIVPILVACGLLTLV